VVSIVFVTTAVVSGAVTVEVSEVVSSLVASPPHERKNSAAANNGSNLNRFMVSVFKVEELGARKVGMHGVRGSKCKSLIWH
jgi:hypothetical protein